jgi:hypothetical protein
MIPKKPAPDSIRGGYRFSEKIMLHPTPATCARSPRSPAFAASHPPALPRLPGRPIMLPERMRARRASSSGEARGTTVVAAHGSIAAGPNAGTRITTRHVNPAPSAAFALNSAKASTALLCGCGARVCKGCNREKADGRQIAHCISLLLTAYAGAPRASQFTMLVARGRKRASLHQTDRETVLVPLRELDGHPFRAVDEHQLS